MRRPSTAHGLALALPAALLMLAAACGSSGRDLREPNRNAVAPTRSTAAPTSSTFAPTSLQLVAEGFEPGSSMPAANTCGGKPPALKWSGVPEATAEVAVALVDFDVTDTTKRIHWLVSGIPAPAAGTTDGSLPAGGALPAGAVTLNNGTTGTPTYDGPCQKPGDQPHTLNFMVFALPAASGLTPATPPADAYSQLETSAAGNVAYYTALA
jgi:phosphatidylethanolamine-binding protein (PEBP) family uncharacterized protein